MNLCVGGADRIDPARVNPFYALVGVIGIPVEPFNTLSLVQQVVNGQELCLQGWVRGCDIHSLGIPDRLAALEVGRIHTLVAVDERGNGFWSRTGVAVESHDIRIIATAS